MANFRPHFKVYITCQGFRNGPLSGPSFRDHENYFFCCVCKVPRQAGSRSQGRAKYLISFLFIACRKIAAMVGHSSPLSGLDHSAGELVHSAGELLHAPSSTRRRRRAVPSSPEALHVRSWRLPPQPMGPRRRRQSRQYRHRHGL